MWKLTTLPIPIRREKKQKEALLRSFDPDLAQKLDHIDNLYALAKNEIVQIDEALYYGERAVSALQQAQSSINTAETAGIFDLLGGGMVSAHIKRSNLDGAEMRTRRAQAELSQFKIELSDLGQNWNQSVEIYSDIFTKDLFWNNVITDTLSQSHIMNAARSNLQSISAIQSKLDEIKNQKTSLEQTCTQLQQKRSELLENL